MALQAGKKKKKSFLTLSHAPYAMASF